MISVFCRFDAFIIRRCARATHRLKDYRRFSSGGYDYQPIGG